jgi:hypothetical protein
VLLIVDPEGLADLWKMMRSKSVARREREIEAEANEDENGVILDSKVSEIWKRKIE